MVPTYRCRRVSEPIHIDGDITKQVWQNTPALALGQAQAKGTLSQSTSVRGCWDGKTLFLAFDCEDRDIRATLKNRDDRVWQEEAVEAFIAPYGDPVHYFEFQCNPLNTLNDIRVTNPNARGDPVMFDRGWTCLGWESAVRVMGQVNNPTWRSRGWTVEWAIPLAALLAPGAGRVLPGEEWRVNLFRIDHWPAEEYSAWSPIPLEPLSFHRPLYFGRWILE